jgi:hypothetical protein
MFELEKQPFVTVRARPEWKVLFVRVGDYGHRQYAVPKIDGSPRFKQYQNRRSKKQLESINGRRSLLPQVEESR